MLSRSAAGQWLEIGEPHFGVLKFGWGGRHSHFVPMGLGLVRCWDWGQLQIWVTAEFFTIQCLLVFDGWFFAPFPFYPTLLVWFVASDAQWAKTDTHRPGRMLSTQHLVEGSTHFLAFNYTVHRPVVARAPGRHSHPDPNPNANPNPNPVRIIGSTPHSVWLLRPNLSVGHTAASCIAGGCTPFRSQCMLLTGHINCVWVSSLPCEPQVARRGIWLPSWDRRPRGVGAGSHPRVPTPEGTYLPR